MSAEPVGAEFLARVARQAEDEVRRRSLPRLPVYLVFFAAVAALTTATRRHPGGVAAFGATLALATAARAALALAWDRFPPARRALRGALWAVSAHALAATWGAGAAAALVFFELGWTTFVVVLGTAAIAASETPALAPAFETLWKALVAILAPPIAVNLLVVGGLRGYALGLFLAAFLAFLLVQGHVQFREHWARLRQSARLLAMIDAVPGTVAWVNADLTYAGVNRATAELRGLATEDFPGRPLGFADPGSPLLPFAKALFQSGARSRAVDAKREVAGVARHYYLFGQKYNHDLEAVILGIDMTESAEATETILRERAQRHFTTRLANLGQVHSRVAPGLAVAFERALDPAATPAVRERARRALAALTALSAPPGSRRTERFAAARLLEDVDAAFGDAAAAQGITLEAVPPAEGPELEGDHGQLLEVLASLVSNAIDAVAGRSGERRVRVELARRGNHCEIAVADTGPGIPESLRARVFEPLFTTKPEESFTGMGLSVSRELVELHGGRLRLDEGRGAGARFVVELPAV
jgi:signal transduction histidine kinase